MSRRSASSKGTTDRSPSTPPSPKSSSEGCRPSTSPTTRSTTAPLVSRRR
uniref:Uncharacterized protein n=1 Tax=Timema poppense TaxID=170557 RepID=A0A7R9DVM7_TIMPO|nr:unnamed protein product [Timema poppensis]